ncbi:MAG: hypothetical protein US56_C0041G0010 [Candidatus Moranbacteria bacterium GW2011_GWF2_37_7]|nr:MAG: hypothetical protein US56_C0041G0010 [Candidatus Moranbacteria bacterium GW2011_GWF2_37_7]
MFEVIILPALLMVIFLFLWHWKLKKMIIKALFHRSLEKTESILINPYHPNNPDWEEFESKYIKY